MKQRIKALAHTIASNIATRLEPHPRSKTIDVRLGGPDVEKFDIRLDGGFLLLGCFVQSTRITPAGYGGGNLVVEYSYDATARART